MSSLMSHARIRDTIYDVDGTAYVTVQEAARLLDVSRTSIYNRFRITKRIAGIGVIPLADVRRYRPDREKVALARRAARPRRTTLSEAEHAETAFKLARKYPSRGGA
jgi:hypothetical protein